MAVTHLTDEQIQAFLDSNQNPDSTTMHHVQDCHLCSERVQEYKTLYQKLNHTPVLNLSKGFEDTILKKVGLLPHASPGFKLWHWIMLAVLFVVITGLSAAFIGVERIVQIQQAIANMLVITGDGLGRVSFVAQNFNLFIVSILVLSAISLLDRLYITRLRR